MALKVKLENLDVDTSLVDIPLFATAEEVIKDIHIEDETIVHIYVEEQDHKENL